MSDLWKNVTVIVCGGCVIPNSKFRPLLNRCSISKDRDLLPDQAKHVSTKTDHERVILKKKSETGNTSITSRTVKRYVTHAEFKGQETVQMQTTFKM